MDVSYAMADLLNTKSAVRRRALLAIEQSGSREATEALVRTLERDEDSFLRAEAARILGQLADLRSADALLAALCRDQEEVAYWAADSLARLGMDVADLVFARARQCNGEGGERSFFWLVQVLRNIGPACVPRLIGLLDTPRWTRRRTVAEAIQRLGPVAEDAVIRTLDHPNPDVRYWLCRILGGIGGNDSVDALTARVDDGEQAVRSVAVSALGRIGSRRAIDFLKELLGRGSGDVRVQIVEVLGVLGRDGCALLIACLDDPAWMVRDRAADCLARLGAEALPLLRKARETGNENVRIHAVKALGQMGIPARAELEAALDDKSPAVRRKAADCLARFPWDQLDGVRRLLGQGGPEQRLAAMRALAACEDERSHSFLLEALQADDPELRRLALERLGRDGEAEYIPVLIRHLADGDDLVRETAQARLEKHPARDALLRCLTLALRDESWLVRRGAALILGQIGRDAVEPLSAVLREENEDARYWAIQALGGIGRDAVRPLIRFLDDSAWTVRRNAAEALIECGDEVAADLLRSLDEKEGISEDRIYWSRYVLEHLSPAILPALFAALRQGGETLRRVVVRLLGRFAAHDEALPPLLDALHDESSVVRLEAIAALGTSGRPDLVEHLTGLTATDLETRLALAEQIARLGGTVGRELLSQWLKDDNWLLRRAVLQGACDNPGVLPFAELVARLADPVSVVVDLSVRLLGMRGDPAVVDSLLPLLDDANHRLDVLESLGRIGGHAAEASLIRFARDDDQRIREAVAVGLARSSSRTAQDVLTELLADAFWNVRRAAAEALNQREENAPEAAEAVEPATIGLEGSADDWYREGQRRRKAGDGNGAVLAFRAALARNPDHVPALSKLGLVCEERGEVAEAIALLERARDLKPELAPVRVYLGIAYSLQKRLDLALPELERACTLAPDSESARIARTIIARIESRG